MTKNIEDLLYRGDSLERMGDISSRLREDSRKYKKAAVRINWELLLKQVSHHASINWREGKLTSCSTALLEDLGSLSSFSSGGGFSRRLYSPSTVQLSSKRYSLRCSVNILATTSAVVGRTIYPVLHLTACRFRYATQLESSTDRHAYLLSDQACAYCAADITGQYWGTLSAQLQC